MACAIIVTFACMLMAQGTTATKTVMPISTWSVVINPLRDQL